MTLFIFVTNFNYLEKLHPLLKTEKGDGKTNPVYTIKRIVSVVIKMLAGNNNVPKYEVD